MKVPSNGFRSAYLPYTLDQVGGSLWYRIFNRTYLDLGDSRTYGSYRPSDIEWIESGGLLVHINKRQLEKCKRLGCDATKEDIAIYDDGTNPCYKENWDRFQKVLHYLMTLQSNSGIFGKKPMTTLLAKLKKDEEKKTGAPPSMINRPITLLTK